MILNYGNNYHQNNAATKTQEEKTAKKGRGWHGDSERHANAGRKGGLARRKKVDSPNQQKQYQPL